MKKDNATLRSINGLATKAAGSSMILMGLLVMVYCAGALIQQSQPLVLVLLLGGLGLFMIALGVDEGFFAEVEVTPTHVRVKKWGNWEEFELKGIEAVDVMRDWLGFGGLILVMVAKGRPSMQINLRQYENRKQLAQSILQRVWGYNKNVLVLPRVERRFGRVPFDA